MPCTGTGNYVEISKKEQFLIIPEKFPHETLDPVATNGITDLFRYGNAESWMCQIIASANNYEIRCIALDAVS